MHLKKYIYKNEHLLCGLETQKNETRQGSLVGKIPSMPLLHLLAEVKPPCQPGH